MLRPRVAALVLYCAVCVSGTLILSMVATEAQDLNRIESSELGSLSVSETHSIDSRTDVRNLSGADILWLLKHAEKVQIERPSHDELKRNKWSKFDWEDLAICNGERGASSVDDGSCDQIADLYDRAADKNGHLSSVTPANPKRFETLIRHCDWATKVRTSGYACGKLGAALLGIGNIGAGKAVLKYAPGCHTRRQDGIPINGCFPTAAYGLTGDQRLEKSDLVLIAESACNQDLDGQACDYALTYGGKIMFTPQEVVDLENARNRADQAFLDRMQQEMARQSLEAEKQQPRGDEKFNAVMDALKGAAGGSDTNAIVNAGNQQAAQIRAIGDANAAAQQQAAAARLAAQKAAQDAAEQRAAAQQAAQQAQQSQQTGKQNGSSGGNSGTAGGGGNGSAGGSTGTYFAPITRNCIREFWDPQHYNWLSFENDCGQTIHLTFIAKSPADHFGAAAADIAAGQSTNTGWSKAEVDAKGNFAMFICPAGSVAVDASTDQAITSPNADYHCKKQ